MKTQRPFAERIRSAISALRGQEPQSRTQVFRSFAGAKVDRLTSEWLATDREINEELKKDLDGLRNRSRDLARNNEYAIKFLRSVVTNIVGTGFTFNARAVDEFTDVTDDLANTAIEKAFGKWCERGNCEITGRQSFSVLCRSVMRAVARDGEYLVKIVQGKQNKFGISLQVLDAQRIDTTLNRTPAQNRNAIVMGVEIDDVGRAVAYHLRKKSSQLNVGDAVRERIDAREILHDFVPFEEEQMRGVPWMHGGMRRTNDLGGYREAAVIAARAGASKMGFYKVSPEVDPESLAESGYKADGIAYDHAEPGEFGILPQGVEFNSYDPTYPHDQFDAFCKGTLRGIASAWGVSYPSLANDLENVNYSSIRAGVLEERDEWAVMQDWFIASFLSKAYTLWLSSALLNQAITLPNGSPLPIAKAEKFQAHEWRGRKWTWVDPERDVNAVLKAEAANLTTMTDECARNGSDYEENLRKKKREQDLQAQLGVKVTNPLAAQPAPDHNPNTPATAN